MFLKKDKLSVCITRDDSFVLDSMDNKPYNLVLNPTCMKRNNIYKVFSILIDDSVVQKKVALIGSLFGADDDIAIFKDNDLLVLMNTDLFLLDCCTLELKMHKTLYEDGVYFSIHEYSDGYVVYGEVDIVKLFSSLEIEWSFSGADIFVANEGSIPFLIDQETILLTDWLGNQYHLNANGKRIE